MDFKGKYFKRVSALLLGCFLILGLVETVKTNSNKSTLEVEKLFEESAREASTNSNKESVEFSKIEEDSELRQIHNDSSTLGNLLEDSNLLPRMSAWYGKALFVKLDSTKTPHEFSYYYHDSTYQDENQNNIQDSEDLGFFNPASTVKVGLASLVLEKLNRVGLERQAEYRIAGSQRWYSFDEDIRRALVISDNDAANRLILWLGFDRINYGFKIKGLHHLVIDRLMLDQGTLVPSPPFEMRLSNEILQQSESPVTVDATCYEIDEKIGNCATAVDLIGGLIRINQPEYFSSEKNFELVQDDREWLKQIMSHTPREEGFDYEDDYCRFLTNSEQKIAGSSGRMLSKCGVSLFSNTYTDLSYLETDSGQKYYVLLSVSPPHNFPEKETIRWMSQVVETVLPKLP